MIVHKLITTLKPARAKDKSDKMKNSSFVMPNYLKKNLACSNRCNYGETGGEKNLNKNCLQKKKKERKTIYRGSQHQPQIPSKSRDSILWRGKKRRGTSIVSKCPLALSGTVRFIHVEKRRALFGLATRTGDEKPRGGIVCIAATFLLARLTLSLFLSFSLRLPLETSSSREILTAASVAARFKNYYAVPMLLPVTYLSSCAQEKEETVLVFFWVFLGWKVFPLIYDFFRAWEIMRNVTLLILLSTFENLVLSIQFCLQFDWKIVSIKCFFSFFSFLVDFNVFAIMFVIRKIVITFLSSGFINFVLEVFIYDLYWTRSRG